MNPNASSPSSVASAACASNPASASNSAYLFLLVFSAALGGLLFGYDTAVVSGAEKLLQKHFALNAVQTGWAASCVLIGCLFGALIAGPLADWGGRKKILITCAVLFTLSALGCAIPEKLNDLGLQFLGVGFNQLVTWVGSVLHVNLGSDNPVFQQYVLMRFLGGLGIGISSMVAPTYLAEIAPEKIRGRLVAGYQLAIVTGIFVVYFVNRWILSSHDDAWAEALGWRWMFGIGVVPAALLGIISLITAESPRWLVVRNRVDQARAIIARISGPAQADKEIAAIRESLKDEQGGFGELFNFKMPLFIAVTLALCSQFCGINAIVYYGPRIFEDSGATQAQAHLFQVIIGAINVVFTVLSMWLVDRLGRKKLIGFGSLVQCLAQVFLVVLFLTVVSKGADGKLQVPPWALWSMLGGVLVFMSAFAIGNGAVCWIIISEIFPNRIRGLAAAIGTAAIWGGCFYLSQIFPWMLENYGPAKIFSIFASASLFGSLFIYFLVPETKGRTLEEIERSWVHH
jgi:SP family arabinose:H+ symporter-like MFS transporter